MEIKDAVDIMNSDFKLWERAETEDLGDGRVVKTINLPWGIGEYSITMEGMTDAGKRRAAVGAYGEHIRGLIDERINDDAVTARAKAAVEKARPVDSGDGSAVGTGLGVSEGSGETQVQEETIEEAEEAYESNAQDAPSLGEELTARRAKVDSRIELITGELDRLCKELRGIDAALEAMVDEE